MKVSLNFLKEALSDIYTYLWEWKHLLFHQGINQWWENHAPFRFWAGGEVHGVRVRGGTAGGDQACGSIQQNMASPYCRDGGPLQRPDSVVWWRCKMWAVLKFGVLRTTTSRGGSDPSTVGGSPEVWVLQRTMGLGPSMAGVWVPLHKDQRAWSPKQIPESVA